MIKYFCDKCGKEVEEKDLVLVMITGQEENGEYMLNGMNPKNDSFEVCPECLKKIKNIGNAFPILDTDKFTMKEQIEKVKEESEEFIEACKLYENGEIGSKKVIEEFFDIIQASLNTVDRLALIHLLEGGLGFHRRKMNDRGWKVKYHI